MEQNNNQIAQKISLVEKAIETETKRLQNNRELLEKLSNEYASWKENSQAIEDRMKQRITLIEKSIVSGNDYLSQSKEMLMNLQTQLHEENN